MPTVPSNFRTTTKARMAVGKKLREKTPRSSHAEWNPPPNRPDPIDTLKASERGLLPALLPIRHARMRQSPFAFLRGAAAIMAADLWATPATGLRVQACGDCHVANFGGFATPERQLVFDINDFDETFPAPWEWDVKRLATSIVLAMRYAGFGERHCSTAARAAVESYRKRMREFAGMTAIDVWYSHMALQILARDAKTPAAKAHWRKVIERSEQQTSGGEFPKITAIRNGCPRIADRRPLIYHSREIAAIGKRVRKMFQRYRETLPHERRIVLDRYEVIDVARKVVGVGSVGTRCAVALLMAGPQDPLLLQLKQARRSVLDRGAGAGKYENQGERVVVGQRLLQSASDIFLGWARDADGHDYYFRQLRDMKMKIDFQSMSQSDWLEYTMLCGRALARAHARTGDPARITGYLGKSDAFDAAVEKFAVAYADQSGRDHAALLKAIRSGKIRARAGAAS